MSQKTDSMDSSKVAKPASTNRQHGGLKSKISVTFSGLILLLGFMVVGIVYHFTGSALQRQVDLRSEAIATNLADATAGMILRKSTPELDALVAKYGSLDGVAYALIQDSKGEILASSLQPFPAELKDAKIDTAANRVTNLRGKDIYETRAGVGQSGFVRVGLDAETLKTDMRATLLPIVGLIVACWALGIVLSIILARRTIRPILELRTIADDISRGRLDTSVSIQTNDEVGELGRSLERMRASLKAATVRVHRE
jgi:HAMP domain-containing protein